MDQAAGRSGEQGFEAHAYLRLKVEGQHGKAEVEHKVLGLQTLQGPTHPEGHHALALNEDHSADDVKGANQEDQNKAGLAAKQKQGVNHTASVLPRALLLYELSLGHPK